MTLHFSCTGIAACIVSFLPCVRPEWIWPFDGRLVHLMEGQVACSFLRSLYGYSCVVKLPDTNSWRTALPAVPVPPDARYLSSALLLKLTDVSAAQCLVKWWAEYPGPLLQERVVNPLQQYLTDELFVTKKLTVSVMNVIKVLAKVQAANQLGRQLPPEAFYNELIRSCYRPLAHAFDALAFAVLMLGVHMPGGQQVCLLDFLQVCRRSVLMLLLLCHESACSHVRQLPSLVAVLIAHLVWNQRVRVQGWEVKALLPSFATSGHYRKEHCFCWALCQDRGHLCTF